MSTHNFGALRSAVIDASRSSTWAQAVEEWQVLSVEEDPHATGICVCGKTGLVYLYTIHNRLTDENLRPIGSSCVNHFEVEELNLKVGVLKRLLALRAAYVDNRTVDLTNEYFSRAVLADLWENDAFPSNVHNRNNGHNDYQFLLDMFNQRRDSTPKQGTKIWVLLNKTIKTFVLNDDRLE